MPSRAVPDTLSRARINLAAPISAPTPLLALVVALTALAAPLDAQRDSQEPRRPKLDGKADPNDAEAYYAHALTQP